MGEALDRQNDALEKLFDAKLSAMKDAILVQAQNLAEHAKADHQEFLALRRDHGLFREELTGIKVGTAVTRVKVALILTGASILSGAVAGLLVNLIHTR